MLTCSYLEDVLMGLHSLPDLHALHGHRVLTPYLTLFVLVRKARVPEAVITPLVSELMMMILIPPGLT